MAIGGFFNLIGAMMQASQQAQANRDKLKLGRENLAFNKKQAAEMRKLMTAPKTDAEGNTSLYVPGKGFQTILDPLIQSIVDAQGNERLKSLTVDASRNREAVERKDSRSKDADNLVSEILLDFKNRRKPNEKEIQANEVLKAVRKNANADGRTDLSPEIQHAMRTGNKEAMKAFSRREPDASLANAIAAAKDVGTQRYLAESSARDSISLQNLQPLLNIANNTTDVPLLFSNDAKDATGRADGALASLAAAIQQGNAGTSNAYARLMNLNLTPPNYGAIFQQLGKIADGAAKKQERKIGFIDSFPQSQNPLGQHIIR